MVGIARVKLTVPDRGTVGFSRKGDGPAGSVRLILTARNARPRSPVGAQAPAGGTEPRGKREGRATGGRASVLSAHARNLRARLVWEGAGAAEPRPLPPFSRVTSPGRIRPPLGRMDCRQ